MKLMLVVIFQDRGALDAEVTSKGFCESQKRPKGTPSTLRGAMGDPRNVKMDPEGLTQDLRSKANTSQGALPKTVRPK